MPVRLSSRGEQISQGSITPLFREIFSRLARLSLRTAKGAGIDQEELAMGAISVLASEGLAAALNASRADVRDMIDGVEQSVESARARLTARLDQVLASSGDTTEGIEGISRDFLETEARPQVFKHMVGVLGFEVGALTSLAGGSVGMVTGAGATLLTVGGVAVTPFLVVLFGLVLMVICSRYSVEAIKHLLDKLGQLISL